MNICFKNENEGFYVKMQKKKLVLESCLMESRRFAVIYIELLQEKDENFSTIPEAKFCQHKRIIENPVTQLVKAALRIDIHSESFVSDLSEEFSFWCGDSVLKSFNYS